MNLGIFGGTFDPVHNGHLIMAHQAIVQLELEKLLIIPACRSPHKPNLTPAGAHDRINMAKLAFEGNKSVEISNIEIERNGASYTIDTLVEVTALYSPRKLYIIIGADSMNSLHLWKNSEKIRTMASIVVAPRSASDETEPDVIKLKMDIVEISSSDIRTRIKNKKPITQLVPQNVESYIIERGIYTNAA